jgi:hypothetical protein
LGVRVSPSALTFSQADTLVFIVLLVFILAQIVIWPHFDRIVRDNEILMGWYAVNDGSIRSEGTMYLVLHSHGLNTSGRWVGLDGPDPLGIGEDHGRPDRERRGRLRP